MRLLACVLFLTSPLLAQNCDFTVTPTSLNVPATQSTGTVQVTTQAFCFGTGWTAISNVTWLHITSGVGYNGSANVTFTIDANPGGFGRSGALTIAAKSVVVNQGGATCNFGVTPLSQNFPVEGGSGTLMVTATCGWFASAGGNFIGVPVGTQGGSDATFKYTVGANQCVAGRSGNIFINTNLPNPPVFTVTQDGSPANLILSATSVTADAAASDGRITVTTGFGCGWFATSDASWLQISSANQFGYGNGAIVYHLLANTVAPRTGTIRVGSSTYMVTQLASGPPTPTLTSVNSAANYAADAVSPGEIVALFGANLGPSTLVPLQISGGALATTLSGTQVLFDGQPAPLIYTLNKQVSAIVPYGVAGKPNTQVQVKYNGALSNAVTVPLQSAHPGIFTQDATGLGPGAILNQDNSLNTGNTRAAIGSVVAIYATGGGATAPGQADGSVTGSTLPFLTQKVVVTIGGIDARVTYSGGVPAAVAGLTQINAEIPAGVTPGPAVPVVVKVGNYASSSGVTLAVK